MSRFDPYDADRPLMLKCGCGGAHAPMRHDTALDDEAGLSSSFIEATLVKALLPSESLRRRSVQRLAADERADRSAGLPVL